VAKSDPVFPVTADHRVMKRLLDTMGLTSKIMIVPEEFDQVSQVFLKSGGSWVGVFRGSSDDLSRLRELLRVAYKEKTFSRR
jgi:hypothetical protein